MLRLLIITRWSHPFGGGESFMYDSMRWLKDKYSEILWISFVNAQTVPHKPYDILRVNRLSDTTAMVEIPNGTLDNGSIDPDILHYWIRLLDPDVVHHQGHDRLVVLRACIQNKCPLVSGFHFWHGAVNLCPKTSNVEIVKHISNHKQDEEFLECVKYGQSKLNCSFEMYWASDFMRDVVQTIYSDIQGIPETCLYPVPSLEHAQCGPGGSHSMVTQINVHEGKGGRLFLYCMNHLRHVAFQGIITEPGSELLYKEIRDSVHRRPAQALILNRCSDIRTVYARANVVLVPSLVDETFCRVAFEAILNGIPVIAAQAGYVGRMLQGSEGAIIIENASSANQSVWLQELRSLLQDPKRLLYMSQKAKDHAQYLLTKYNSPGTLESLLVKVHSESIRRRIMIFAPWADQGLGVQARNYANILERCQCEVFIFSYLPYYGSNQQACPAEWEHDHVYYSPHIREKVTNQEIIDFVQTHKIGTAIIPETCWFRVFEIAELLSNHRVRVFAVPNVEILRKDEIHKHQIFDGLLCNNQICMNVLSDKGLGDMCHHIGYAINNHANSNERIMQFGYSTTRQLTQQGPLKFLCVGGMNAFSRKQVDQVCAAFREAHTVVKDIQLTVTNQNVNETSMQTLIDEYKDEIVFIWKALSYDEVMTMYLQCDIVIQVSKHEGLGIGFYEALSFGKPVITLDVSPHNEIVRPNINGWLIKATTKPSVENVQSPIGSAFFDYHDLANEMIQIGKDGKCTNMDVMQDYVTRFDVSSFTNRFIEALRL